MQQIRFKIRNKVIYLEHDNQITITRKQSLQLNNPIENKQLINSQ